MATVDRKNDTDEKHSLSSFDKRKVQSVTFGARHFDRKKYKAVKHGTVSPRAAPKENVRCQVDNEVRAPLEHEGKVGTDKTFKNNYVKQDNHGSIHHRNPENTTDISISGISPEVAQHMQRAAFIQQMNNDKISQNVATAESASYEYDVSTPRTENVESNLISSASKSESEKISDKPIKSAVDDYKNCITPEMAQRMKRVAFLAQQNKEAISINIATVIPTDDFHNTERIEKSEKKPEIVSEKPDEKEEQQFESRFTGNSKHADFNRFDNAHHEYAVNQANSRYQTGQRYKQQSRENDRHDRHRDVLDEISSAATITGQLGRGEVGKAVADIVIHNEFSSNGAVDTVKSIGNAVSGSSSVSSAIPDVATTLAAVEAKKIVARIMKGENSEKDRKFVEEHKAAGKTKYVDSNKDRFKVEHRIPEDEHVAENMSREERRNSLHNKRVAEKQKNFYADRMKTERKNKQKEMFLDFNKDNPELVSNTAKGTGKRYVKKKATKALVGGGAAAAVFPIIIVIIIFAVIAVFFGWLSPFDYTLAGDEGEEDDRKYTAESNAEVIDGYTKMIKNYMDVCQAYYYFNYGDWYGGTYEYPAPDLDFSEFFSEYCRNIVSEIQSQFSASLAAAKNDRERAAIAQAMNRAISEAIDAAMPQALAEYNALMKSLDDSMTAETQRQHYETKDKGGGNGSADSAEFTGMPIVGTNHFDNVEIHSELSAEELLAYIALYKSMSIINSDDSDSNAEQILNITPQDIMDFFKETEFFSITVNVTHGNTCGGQNCRRTLVDKSWEYYCDGSHDNLSGEIGPCKTADELCEKIMEITDSEANGVDEKSFEKLIEEYMKLINKELDITEADYRRFGAADSAKADEFYQKLIEDGEIPNNYWSVDTPMGGEDSDE